MLHHHKAIFPQTKNNPLGSSIHLELDDSKLSFSKNYLPILIGFDFGAFTLRYLAMLYLFIQAIAFDQPATSWH